MQNQHSMVKKARANAFIIWRAGNSVDWDCTAKEIADETGISYNTVLKTCKKRGWKIKTGFKGTTTERLDVVHRMNLNKHRQFHE